MTSVQDPEIAQPSDPADPDAVNVTGYRDAVDAFRCPALAVTIDEATVPFRAETVLRVDGKRHATRRRVLNELSRRDGHARFRRRYLVPTVADALGVVLGSPDPDGYARMDLPTFGKQVFLQLAAAITGFDNATGPEGAAELFELMEAIHDVLSVRFVRDGRDEVIDRAHTAKERIRTRYFAEALTHRRELVARHERGELGASALPHDLLTLIARRADPRWDDPELALREAIQMVSAATHTSTLTLTNAVDDLAAWFAAHPEDHARRIDKEFLLTALRETLRLHSISPYFARVARERVTLGSGLEIAAGQRVHLCTPEASRDPDTYGENADRFELTRGLPRNQAHGLAFGSGTHMCFGLPFVLGSEGIDGNHVHVLERLYAAGMEPDPDHPREVHGADTDRPYIERLGVRFRVSLPNDPEPT